MKCSDFEKKIILLKYHVSYVNILTFHVSMGQLLFRCYINKCKYNN